MKSSIICSAAAFLLLASGSWAQERENKFTHEDHQEHLEEVIVTTPFARSETETVFTVDILSDDELREKAAATIGETLKDQLGVHNSSFGTGVGVPIIRGQGAGRVTVLQNATSSQDASTISADHAIGIEAVLAERIEVLRGPATLLYGNGAIGGVVNVIDNRVPSTVPEALTGVVEARADSNGDAKNLVGKLEGGGGQFAWHLSGFYRDNENIEIPGFAILEEDDHHDEDEEGHDDEEEGHHDEDEEEGHHEEEEVENTNGFIGNSDAEAKGGTVGFSWVGSKGYIGFAVNHLENDYGIPPGAHGHHEEEGHHDEDEEGHDDEEEGHHDEDEEEEGHDDEEEGHHEEEDEDIRLVIEQTRYDLRGEWSPDNAITQTVKAWLTVTDYEHVEVEGNGEIGTTFSNEATELRLEWLHQPINEWYGVVGLQWLDREFFAIGEEAFVPKSDLNSLGVFALESLKQDNLIWEFGGRVEFQDVDAETGQSADHTTFSGSAGLIWNIDDQQHLDTIVSVSQRAPSIEALFSNGEHIATRSFEVGDVSLDEETSTNIEVSYHLHREFDLTLNVFYNSVSDYIFQRTAGQVFNPDIDGFEAECSADDEDECLPVLRWSQDDADFWGYEAEFIWPFIKDSANRLDLKLFSDYVRGEFDTAGDVPRMPPLRYGAELSAGWGDNWSGYLRWTEADEQDRPGINEEPTAGYSRLDLGVQYKIKAERLNATIFFKAKNLLDEEIRNSTSFLREFAPEAGRGFELGVTARF